MRLECEVIVQKESVGPGRVRKSKGIITLGKNKNKGASGYVLQVSTPSDRSQTPIEITPINVVTILKPYVASGRATFIFRSPAVRVMVQKASPDRLLRFIEKCTAILKGEEVDLNVLSRVKTTDFKPTPRILRVQSDTYRNTNYPASLEELYLNQLSLNRIDGRWFSCPLLTTLDFSDNFLGEAPDFGKLKLVSRLKNLRKLSLAGNRIRVLPEDITRALPVSLIELNMTDNQLIVFPNSLLRLKNLRSLSLSRNRLTRIPTDISLLPLHILRLDGNHLQTIPYSVTKLRLLEFTIDNNHMMNDGVIYYPKMPSLVSLGCAAVRTFRLPESLLPRDIQIDMEAICARCTCCMKWFARLSFYSRVVFGHPLEFSQQTDNLNQVIPLWLQACPRCCKVMQQKYND